MLLAEQIALWADKLRDISALGLQFSKNMYDLEHYQRIQDIAMAMLAFATNESLSELEPIRAVLKDLYKSRHQYDSLLSSCFDESCFQLDVLPALHKRLASPRNSRRRDGI